MLGLFKAVLLAACGPRATGLTTLLEILQSGEEPRLSRWAQSNHTSPLKSREMFPVGVRLLWQKVKSVRFEL